MILLKTVRICANIWVINGLEACEMSTETQNINNPFLSIVMPVYRVEKVLTAAVEDVLNQTFADFELILVDDCSPDCSGEICDQLAQRDNRIKVIHLPQNGGASNARNQGIQIAQGIACATDLEQYHW